jgi:putative cobalt transporter subunit CbtB
MTNILQKLTKSSHGVPKLAVGILLVLFGVGFFSVGFDQGQLFSLIEGPKAYGDMYLHEFSHDMRHASGFPCH